MKIWHLFSIPALGLLTPGSQALEPVWRLTPELRIDGKQHSLDGVTFVNIGIDGEMAIGQSKSNAIFFFDSSGRRVATFGRRGAGPGEFQSLGLGNGRIGNSFWATDVTSGRIYVLDQSHRLKQEIAGIFELLPSPNSRPRFIRAKSVLAIRPDQVPVFLIGIPEHPDSEWARLFRGHSSVLATVNSKGTIQKVLSYNASNGACDVDIGGTTMSLGGIGLCATPMYFGSQDGRRIIINESFNLDPKVPPQARVTAISTTGDTLFTRTFTSFLPPIPQREKDSIRATAIKESGGNAGAREWSTKVPFPAYYPFFGKVVAGLDGTTWVSFRAAGANRTWVVLDPKGKTLARLDLPKAVQIRAADRQNVWTVELDDDDVPSVVRNRIVRP